MNKLFKQHNYRGDTIVEVLFAMAIIGMTIGVGYGIANRAIMAGRDAQEQTEASKFAEAQLEKLIIATTENPAEYFDVSEPAGTQFCIDDTLGRVEPTDTDTECRFGTVEQNGAGSYGRYGITIVRTGGLFVVTSEWNNSRGNYESSNRLVYRTYDYSVAVGPPPPIVPTTPSSVLGISIPSVNAGYDTATFNANVSGSPVSATFTFTRSDGYTRTINIPGPVVPANISLSLGAIAPGESYTYLFTITDAASNTLSTSTSPLLTFTTLTPANMASANTPLPIPGQSKYYRSVGQLSCSAASADSAGKGGHLVTIGSAAENTTVAGFAGTYIWIGYNDIATEGNWQWVPVAPKVFEAWYDDPTTSEPEEPNNWPPGEDCAVMNWNAFGRWNDWFDNAASTAYYVIEYEID